MTQGGRISRARIIGQLKLAAKKGDRAALALATDQMKTWAYSPRYWEKYLELLRHPLARLVDLLLIKQGERIARQKGWVKPKRERVTPAPARPRKARQPAPLPVQPLLFPDFLSEAPRPSKPPRQSAGRGRLPR